MQPPQYIALAISQANRRIGGSYDQAISTQMWKVSLANSYYNQTAIDLYYLNEEDARQFAQFSVYTPAEILKITGRDQAGFRVKAIDKAKTSGGTSPYTDKAITTDIWRAQLEADNGNGMDWSYPTEAEVRQRFSTGKTYTAHDLLGTTASVPISVSQAFDFAAQQALQAAIEQEQAETDLENAKANAAQAVYQADVTAELAAGKSLADAQVAASKAATAASTARGKATAAQTKADAAIGKPAYVSLLTTAIQLGQAADQAEQTAGSKSGDIAVFQQRVLTAINTAQVAFQKAKQLAKGAAQRTIPTRTQEYTIVEGGSAGYYNEVFYKSGTFTVKNGQWSGIFRPA